MAFGGGLDDDNSEVMSEINMTPLVDVMLVLLIIFIITVPVITNSVKVDLPRASNTPNDIKPDTVTLSITAEGLIHWDKTELTMEDLEQRLLAAAAKPVQPEVHIRGDRSASYEHVLKVMAAVQQSGILKLGFVTEPES
ncbi:Biopolymer transport protein ExbD [Zhongshania aliphaticivorans]|uniref:Biopolymer transport protein ExbD n=1 Tax=Zhongshania aliphaticivorans TaxID=1470434 RepID=A0A5S9NNI1_9GAMM|nr:biopolymer transporter ExbD [Zhongshania aliphaticivorans]CAA0091894.1 Biopolymer transport protein ExbD [Zhongshania aliphaticivorans]CAA0099230.1 Biopolymer transport protein ExbD [Zhongshania aliphaticivorans]